MFKNFFSMIFVLIVTNLSAQTVITRSAISSIGYTNTVGSTKLLCTVGELNVNEITHGVVHISEGFINPELAIITGVSEYSNKGIDVSLYPNPAVNFVNVKFSKQASYKIDLYSANGKMIKTYTTYNTLKQIPVSNLSVGKYLLIIKNKNNKTYRTFKLIKK